MDRAELSSAIIQEMQALVGEVLEGVVPQLWTADLATLEQRVQQVGRVLLGQLIERVVQGRGQRLPRPARCAECGGALTRRERPRPLVGLVGDYTLRRPYYWCAACKRGAAPLDAVLGLGAGTVSPGLARVVARATLDAPFSGAVDQVQEALGLSAPLSDETARRLAEQLGTVAEAQTQAAIARAKQGQPVWAAAEIQSAEGTTTLAVAVDGVLVQHQAGWQEMKVGTLAPLGPKRQTDADSGQRTADSGQRTADSGQRTADSGQRTADSGQRTADAPTWPGACRATRWGGRRQSTSGGASTWRRGGAAWARRPCAPWSCWAMARFGSGSGRAPSWAWRAQRWWRSWISITPTASCGPSATRSMGRARRRRRPGLSRSRISSMSVGLARCWRRWPPSTPPRPKPRAPSPMPRPTLPTTPRAWITPSLSPARGPSARAPWRVHARA